MNRLWTVGGSLGVVGLVALADSIRFDKSAWPGVVLFCVAGLLACVAAAMDASASETEKQDSQDVDERLEAIEKRVASDAELVAKVIKDHALDIDHLKKRDALNSLG